MPLRDIDTGIEGCFVRHSRDQTFQIGRRYLQRIWRAICLSHAIIIGNPDQRWLCAIFMAGQSIWSDQTTLQHIGSREWKTCRLCCIRIDGPEIWPHDIVLTVEWY